MAKLPSEVDINMKIKLKTKWKIEDKITAIVSGQKPNKKFIRCLNKFANSMEKFGYDIEIGYEYE